MSIYTTQEDAVYRQFPYTKEHRSEILYIKQFGDITGLIMDYGTHPCSYIIFPAKRYAIYSSMVNSDTSPVHGGITLHGKELSLGDGRRINGYIIGWDYCHSVDYNVWTESGHKYTILQLISDLVDTVLYIHQQEEYYDAG